MSSRISCLFLILLMVSCSTYSKIQQIVSGEISLAMSVSDECPDQDDEICLYEDSIKVVTDAEGSVLMNAVRDDVTGEMVAVDVLSASRVVASFRNVAERGGWVTIGFDVNIPSAMADSKWQLKLFPMLYVRKDTMRLDPLFVTGKKYRQKQMRGYQRYRDFVASILTDTTDFIRMGQLEIFLERNFPDIYAMKTDTALVCDDLAEGVFGVTQAEAARYYVRHLRMSVNERRKARISKVYDKYVRDPIVSEGVRLDTVITSSDGNFVYKYVHTFKTYPGLKNVILTLDGEIYEDGVFVGDIPYSDSLTFYISTLSSIADTLPRYKIEVNERKICEKLRADIAFRKGSHDVDSTLYDNASELLRVLNFMHSHTRREEYVFDSLLIVASCSPEGRYAYNKRLSASRADAVRKYVGSYLPDTWSSDLKTSYVAEDWERLQALVAAERSLSEDARSAILEIISEIDDPDLKEKRLSRLPEYEFLRKKVYPQLRTVTFDLHMHQAEMGKDTIQTSVLDTLYMNGIEALRDMDYKKATALLGPYKDYNAALAYIAADMNHTALKILDELDPENALICYLKAIVLCRLEMHAEAARNFELSITKDPKLEYRANLDPEMSLIINGRKKLTKN